MDKQQVNVIALGLTADEQETLRSILSLSERYNLLPETQAEQADIVLVDLDDPDTRQRWKTEIDRPSLSTIVLADKPIEHGGVSCLQRRYVQRRCFAKQVLGALHLALLKLPPREQHAASADKRTLDGSKINQVWLTLSDAMVSVTERCYTLRRPAVSHNAYYY